MINFASCLLSWQEMSALPDNEDLTHHAVLSTERAVSVIKPKQLLCLVLRGSNFFSQFRSFDKL